MLLLCALVVGSGSLWAVDKVYKTALFGSTNNSKGVSSYTTTWYSTTDEFRVDIENFNNNNNGWSGQIKCGRNGNASVATITTNAAIDKAVTKVAIKIEAINSSNTNSIKLYTSSNGSTWTEAGSFTKSTGTKEVSLASPTANLYYKVEFDCKSGSGNGFNSISKVEYYYSVAEVHVTGVSLNKTSTSIVCGNTETLTATVTPAEATNKNVTWTSSNDAIASISSSGVVTANAVGTATITVTTEDQGETATCTVTVTENSTKPTLLKTILEETFAGVTGTSGIGTENFDNTGWTKTGDIYGNSGNGIRMAKGSGAGSITTPALTDLTEDGTLTFEAKGWDSDEISISLNGSNCTLSPNSFNDLSYSDFTEKTVSVTVTGSNPTITFSAASGVRIYLNNIKISMPSTTIDVVLNASGFASYCSPFALDLTPTSDYAAYAVAAAGDNALTFTKIPGKVAANTPIILYSTTTTDDAVSIPVIEDDDPAIAAVSGNELIGTLSPTYVTATSGHTNYGLKGDKFIRFNAGAVKANKAYLSVDNSMIDAGAHEIAIIFDNGETTSIEEVNTQKTINNGFFNLAGQRVAQPTKGLYILNGKKVIVK